MKIKVFADTICGWCYIGHTRLLQALKNFKDKTFFFEYAPFQLNPDMPKKGIKRQDYLKYKFGSKEAAKPMYDSMVKEALKENLKFNLEEIKITPNTNFSHILIKLAFSKNIGHEVLSKIFEIEIFWSKLADLVILMKKKLMICFHQTKKSIKLTKVIF